VHCSAVMCSRSAARTRGVDEQLIRRRNDRPSSMRLAGRHDRVSSKHVWTYLVAQCVCMSLASSRSRRLGCTGGMLSTAKPGTKYVKLDKPVSNGTKEGGDLPRIQALHGFCIDRPPRNSGTACGPLVCHVGMRPCLL
jgi:hypothetical protein